MVRGMISGRHAHGHERGQDGRDGRRRSACVAIVVGLALLGPQGLLARSPGSEGSEGSERPGALLRDGMRGAELVVRGEVERAEARQVDAGRRIVTIVTLRVTRRYLGEGGTRVRVRLPGGRLGDLAQRVGGVPLVAPGDRLLLMLRRRFGRLPPRAAPFELARLGRSIWRVERGRLILAPDAVTLQTRPGAWPRAEGISVPLETFEHWMNGGAGEARGP